MLAPAQTAWYALGFATDDCLTMRSPEEFNEESALAAAMALQQVLEERTHKRKYLGQIYTVPGKLGEALNLPKIISRLSSKVAHRRESGLDEFEELWATLSLATQSKVLEAIDWYDPESLSWDDKRSNRRPVAPGAVKPDINSESSD